MKKKAVVISLNGNPAHVSHIVAYYKLLEECGFESELYILSELNKFIPEDVKYVNHLASRKSYELVVFESPSKINLMEMIKFRLFSKCRVLYVYHEPLGSIKTFISAKVPISLTLITYLKDMIHYVLLPLTDIVLIPSKRALEYYQNGLYKIINSHYEYLPLLYDDEYNESYKIVKRKYFAYIGGIAADHAFPQYLSFIKTAINNNDLIDYNFLIASRTPYEKTDDIKKMIDSGRLKMIVGKRMSNEEINTHYASSFIIWNAYSRTTQSGVLAKSSMFGTPAIIMKNNISEFVSNNVDVFAISDNNSYNEIANAIKTIRNDFERYEKSCRSRFLSTYYYGNYKNQMKAILNGDSK